MSKIPKIPKMGKPYPYPLIPFILGIPSMVLVLLTIYAGHAPGYLEDYHIVYVSQILDYSHQAFILLLILTRC